GARAVRASTWGRPGRGADAAGKARVRSSSVRSDGRAPMDGYKVQETGGGEVPRRSVRPLPLQRAYRQTGAPSASAVVAGAVGVTRSEERRVGKEGWMCVRLTLHPADVPGPTEIVPRTVPTVALHDAWAACA